MPDASLLPEDSDRLTLIVPQEQAFGTGSHETTCALHRAAGIAADLAGQTRTRRRRRQRHPRPGHAPARRARTSIAFDNDNDAYGALRDNRIRNGVPESAMPLFIGGVEALRGGAFDVITMNIIPEVIMPLLGDVVARLAADARLILSGILVTKRDDVVDAARAHGLTPVSERTKGEWWAGVLMRDQAG